MKQWGDGRLTNGTGSHFDPHIHEARTPPARWQDWLHSKEIPEWTRPRPYPGNSKRRKAKNFQSSIARAAIRTHYQGIRAQVYKRNKHRRWLRRPPQLTRIHRKNRQDKRHPGPGPQEARRSAASPEAGAVKLHRPRKIGAPPAVHNCAGPSTQASRPR